MYQVRRKKEVIIVNSKFILKRVTDYVFNDKIPSSLFAKVSY